MGELSIAAQEQLESCAGAVPELHRSCITLEHELHWTLLEWHESSVVADWEQQRNRCSKKCQSSVKG